MLTWEVYNEGRLPYENRSNAEVVESLNAGLRLLKPRLAPDAVYLLMEWCWKEVGTGIVHISSRRTADSKVHCNHALFYVLLPRNQRIVHPSLSSYMSWPPSQIFEPR